VSSAGTYPALVRKLSERFEATLDEGGLRPVLVLDEAHELRPEVLSMLRLLTNFKMDSRLVLSLVLAGQPPLATLLRRDDQEAIARRLAYYGTLRTLSDQETRAYIEHRCAVVGAARSPFDAASVDAIYEMSRGNLRAIDSLALEALHIAARAKTPVVSPGHIIAARKVLWP
jgi:general secretion pathway protein A